jgi:hypothetical protein
VSHAPERKEKDCLNCGTIVQGRFCHVCGQANIVPKEKFGSLVLHFFYDITHFDTKFFNTLRALVFKPGFLSKEYMEGRRGTYLHPVRMYLFTSAIFFLIFFSLMDPEKGIRLGLENPLTKAQRDSARKDILKELQTLPADINLKKQLEILSDTTRDITGADLLPFSKEEGPLNISGEGHNYKSREEYDSIQHSLQKSKRDDWFTRRLIKTEIKINEDFRQNPKGTLAAMGNTFLHRLPYLLFVSLPFFALILKLLYIRRKQFYYADHIIFTIHHYIFSFLFFLVVFGISELQKLNSWRILNILMAIVIIAWPLYLYVAMKKFYRQRWFKTLVKFILLNILALIVLLILFIIFFFFSVFQL